MPKCPEYYFYLVFLKYDERMETPRGSAMGICIAMGVVFGVVFDNIAIGIAFGVVVGAVLEARNNK